ncbi:MAG: hypothetical protein BWX74_00456 [Tenericutes bacterium ADurb.Bin087]|nr:MAG: hypothetical protein BWX74_00456 [Tenericutes bacterium ADurb.Bin087]
MKIFANTVDNDTLTIVLFFAFLLLAVVIYLIVSKKEPPKEKMRPEERVLKMVEMPLEEKVVASAEEVKIEEKQTAVKAEPKKVAVKKEVKVKTAETDDQFAAIKYSYSYTAQVSLAPQASRERYLKLKQEILAYESVNNTISWREERFTLSGKTIIKFKLIGNILRMYIALSTEELSEVNIKIDDVSQYKEHEITPSLLRISGNTGVKRALQAIELLMAKLELKKDPKYKPSNDDLPAAQNTDELLAAGLIRKI